MLCTSCLPVSKPFFQYAIAEDIFVLGYLRGEVSGCKREHFISPSTLRSADESTLHEIYAGGANGTGFLISYRLNKSSDDKLDEVRRSIANPHSITGSWKAFESQYEGSPAKPIGNTDQHWDSADFYRVAYKSFYEALERENGRIHGGGFSVAPGTYNTVTWETKYMVKTSSSPDKDQVVQASDCLPHYYRGRAAATNGMAVFLQDPASVQAIKF